MKVAHYNDGHSEMVNEGEFRIPLARDYAPGRRMRYLDRTVIYSGRSASGNFIFEDGRNTFITLWPFQVRVKNTAYEPTFDEAKWKREKEETEYKAWVEKTNESIAAINKRIRTRAIK